MNPVKKLDDRVEVAVVYKNEDNIETSVFPAKMVWNDKTIVFTKLGIHYPTRHGHKVVHVFSMSDGKADYKLEFDAERLTWTLTEILQL